MITASLEEVVVVRLGVLEFVGQFLLDIREDRTIFLLDLIGLQRPLGLPLHLKCLEIPGPQMLGTGQDTADHHAGFRQRFFHMRTNRWNRAIAGAVVHEQDGNAVDVKFLDGVLCNLVGPADPLPRHFFASLVLRRHTI